MTPENIQVVSLLKWQLKKNLKKKQLKNIFTEKVTFGRTGNQYKKQK